MRLRPPWLLNLLLFLATVASTLLTGAGASLPPDAGVLEVMRAGVPFSAALIGILGCHEMGHYLMARRYGVDSTLPYFIPLPAWSPVGTLGAFIRIRSPFTTRASILDIGAAGPLAGFVVALPLLFYGFATAHPTVLPVRPPGSDALQSPLALLLAWVRHEPIAFAPSTGLVMDDSLLTWLAARLTHGPLPEGHDLELGPVGFAAWFGMFVTMMNLLPIGQLDGGHVLRAAFGPKAKRYASGVSWALAGLAVCASWTWLVWFALTRFLLGTGHPPPLDDAPLPPGKRWVVLASLVVLVLTFVPVPFRI